MLPEGVLATGGRPVGVVGGALARGGVWMEACRGALGTGRAASTTGCGGASGRAGVWGEGCRGVFGTGRAASMRSPGWLGELEGGCVAGSFDGW
jgi:hypothetical protein